MLALVGEHLEGEGHAVTGATRGADAISRLRTGEFDVVLTDLRLPDADGMEVLRVARESQRDVPVILFTAFGSIETAIQAIRQGAYDYVTKPFALEEISLLVGKALEDRRLREENRRLREEVAGRYRFENLLGNERGHAGGLRPHPPGGSGRRQCPHHRRERHGKGTGGQGAPLQQRPRRAGPSSRSTAPPSPPACWRASSSAT